MFYYQIYVRHLWKFEAPHLLPSTYCYYCNFGTMLRTRRCGWVTYLFIFSISYNGIGRYNTPCNILLILLFFLSTFPLGMYVQIGSLFLSHGVIGITSRSKTPYPSLCSLSPSSSSLTPFISSVIISGMSLLFHIVTLLSSLLSLLMFCVCVSISLCIIQDCCIHTTLYIHR